MKSIQYLTLDINKRTQQTITANVGDVGSRFVKIQIVDEGKPINLIGVDVYLYALKSDNTKLFNVVVVEDDIEGIVLAELTSQVLVQPGNVKLTLVLIEGNNKLSSKEFTLNVENSIFSDEVVESTNEFSALTTSLVKVEEWNGYFEETSGQIEQKYTARLNKFDEQFNTIVNKSSGSYIIELDRFNIYNDGTHAQETTDGLNDALFWCKNNGITEISLPKGRYLIDTSREIKNYEWLAPHTNKLSKFTGGLGLYSNQNINLNNSILQMLTTNQTDYSIIFIGSSKGVSLKAGEILGDLDNHITPLRITGFEKGKIGSDGNNVDVNTGEVGVRTNIFISQLKDGSQIPDKFRLIPFLNVEGGNTVDGGRYCICWYDENDIFISKSTVLWLNEVTKPVNAKKFKLSLEWYEIFKNDKNIEISLETTTSHYTREFGFGINMTNSENISLSNLKISKCTGDAIIINNYNNGNSKDCVFNNLELSHCRRQGISFIEGKNFEINNCEIHDIKGVDPQSGIDFEHYAGENFGNILVKGCKFYNNHKLDIINYNGHHIFVENCRFGGQSNITIGTTYGHTMSIDNCLFEGLNTNIYLGENSKLINCTFNSQNVNLSNRYRTSSYSDLTFKNCNIIAINGANCTVFDKLFFIDCSTASFKQIAGLSGGYYVYNSNGIILNDFNIGSAIKVSNCDFNNCRNISADIITDCKLTVGDTSTLNAGFVNFKEANNCIFNIGYPGFIKYGHPSTNFNNCTFNFNDTNKVIIMYQALNFYNCIFNILGTTETASINIFTLADQNDFVFLMDSCIINNNTSVKLKEINASTNNMNAKMNVCYPFKNITINTLSDNKALFKEIVKGVRVNYESPNYIESPFGYVFAGDIIEFNNISYQISKSGYFTLINFELSKFYRKGTVVYNNVNAYMVSETASITIMPNFSSSDVKGTIVESFICLGKKAIFSQI